jgi:2-oxoacid:acceptor oxidoreductase gamma subunit (pyruvate/2-ketoisovalerate family)
MKEIRIHGRGGQGSVLAGEIIIAALVMEGKSGSSFPSFGFERRGAPVTAFVRISNVPIKERTQIYEPDCLIVLDPVQIKWPQTYSGIKPNSTVILNSTNIELERPHKNVDSAGIIDATRIALQEIGRDAVNTCLLGAFAATTGWVNLDSLVAVLGNYFEQNIVDKNVRCLRRGYEEVNIKTW